ncbi:MAG: hypothetical protein AAB922_05425 [Patescibacteria group bacterium]
MKKLFAFLFLLYLFLPTQTLAARSISVTSDKGSIYGIEEANISASISGFTNGEKIYIKGAFFKDGSTNYFGYTKSGDSWIKNSTSATGQRQVEIANWDQSVIVRSDFDDSGYEGKGEYKFKLGFYYTTSGGNLSSVNWSNSISFSLDSPAPTSLPVVTSQTTISNSKTSSSNKAPTPTKTASNLTSSSTLANTTSQTGNNFAKITQNSKISSDFARIRNISPTSEKVSGRVEVLGTKEQNFSFMTILTVILGLALILAAGGFWAFKNLEQIKTWIKK